jgi:two-component system LytT family sensor kinase
MRRWISGAGLILLVWTLLGLYTAHQLYFLSRGSDHPITWRYALAHQLSYSYFWALQTPVILWLTRRLSIRPRTWILFLPLHLIASSLLSFPPRIFQQVWLAAVGLNPTLTLDPMTRFGSFGLIDYGIVFYWAILLFAHLREYSEREHEGQLKATELEAELAKAQLDALRFQLNPHFLFNSLNTIVELIHENPKAADRMLTGLGELLRVSLSSSNAQEVPLSQEVEFLLRYIEIEKIRFDDRLHVTFAVESPTLDAMVPNLLLQPLVENAIKHGIAGLEAPGYVRIESAFDDGRLRLRVADNGCGLTPDEPPEYGTGLANTRSRLTRLYGSQYEFITRNQEHGGFETIVVIPRKTRDDSSTNH